MPPAPTHEIVLKGRIAHHLLGPFVDDFVVVHGDDGCTRLVGVVVDPAHVHGLVAHLASINAELIAITPIRPNDDDHQIHQHHQHHQQRSPS